jgi:hypothetical protein
MSFERVGIAFIEAEVALRKSIFLKGYELGKGRPLTNEEQQEVVDTLYQKAYDDSLARTREERVDLRQSIRKWKEGVPRVRQSETESPNVAPADTCDRKIEAFTFKKGKHLIFSALAFLITSAFFIRLAISSRPFCFSNAAQLECNSVA